MKAQRFTWILNSATIHFRPHSFSSLSNIRYGKSCEGGNRLNTQSMQRQRFPFTWRINVGKKYTVHTREGRVRMIVGGNWRRVWSEGKNNNEKSIFNELFTCRWMKTTEPSKRHVPPCRSTWSIRRICRNRIPRIALVANTCPLLPNVSTTSDATTTMRSVNYWMNDKKKREMENFMLKEFFL